MIIRFSDGSPHEALILSLSGSVIRVALKDCPDAVELTLVGQMWFCSEAQQEVFFEFSLDAEEARRLVWNRKMGVQEFFRPMMPAQFARRERNADAESQIA